LAQAVHHHHRHPRAFGRPATAGMARPAGALAALVGLRLVGSSWGAGLCKTDSALLPDVVFSTSCEMTGIAQGGALCCAAGGEWKADEEKCEKISRSRCAGAGGRFEETKCSSMVFMVTLMSCDAQIPNSAATMSQYVNHIASQCCSDGLGGCVADGTSVSNGLCLNSNALQRDKMYEVKCMGIDQTACCSAGGKWEKDDDDYCLKDGFCKLERMPDIVQACTSAGGTASGTACSTMSSGIGMLGCNDPFPDLTSGLKTMEPYLNYLATMCCSDGKSKCSSPQSATTSNMCLDACARKNSAIFNFKCKGMTQAQCGTAQGEWKVDADEDDVCLRSGFCEIMGGDTQKCSEVGGVVDALTCEMLDFHISNMQERSGMCNQNPMMVNMAVTACCSDGQSICSADASASGSRISTCVAASTAASPPWKSAPVVAGSAALAFAFYASSS